MAKKKKTSDLTYIMNPRCGWCKKADPVVEELRAAGHDITTLDVTDTDAAKKSQELQAKFNIQCGTPLFLDAKTGNSVCGMRGKEILEKWANGEEIPAPPPRPKPQNAPQRPQNAPQQPPAEQWPKTQFIKLDYVWVDGKKNKQLRSKTRFVTLTLEQPPTPEYLLGVIPESGFDGSSTNQATTEDSDCILRPVRVYPNMQDRGRDPSFIVMCEVFDSTGKPHKSNTRAELRRTLERVGGADDLWFAVEQEYTITEASSDKPIGWPDGEPKPQGDYYCGLGSNNVKGRRLAEQHAFLCNNSGVLLDGFHPEVMLSQWEYQTRPKIALRAADDLWFTRYLLQKTAEMMDMSISFDPKPVEGDWNGSGAHINFSTKVMREKSSMDYLNLMCATLKDTHEDAIAVYGPGNDRRLSGKHETSAIDIFSWGESDRSASIRIPLSTANNNGIGHIEDRRPAANVDPYAAFSYLTSQIVSISQEVLATT